jgi:Holliday junction resolvase
MINSKIKGKIGELELAAFLREHGFEEARRGVQYSGGNDSPDIVGLPGFHIECKRTERGSLYDWLAQAQSDAAGSGRVPFVAHRKNRREWVAILGLEDFLNLVRKVNG